jgi:hypothetical protein
MENPPRNYALTLALSQVGLPCTYKSAPTTFQGLIPPSPPSKGGRINLSPPFEGGFRGILTIKRDNSYLCVHRSHWGMRGTSHGKIIIF